MDFSDLQSKIKTVLESSLTLDELKTIHNEFIRLNYYQLSTDFIEAKQDKPNLIEAIEFGISKNGINDLKDVAPATIKELIKEFHDAEKCDEGIHHVDEQLEQEEESEEHITKSYRAQKEQPQDSNEHDPTQDLPGISDTLKTEVEKRKEKPPLTDSGINAMPGKPVICDTARRMLAATAYSNLFHLLSQSDRQRLPYAHCGIDARGNSIRLIRKGEYADLSMIETTIYCLINTLVNYRAYKREADLILAERDMFLRDNEEHLKKAHMYEQVLIIQALGE